MTNRLKRAITAKSPLGFTRFPKDDYTGRERLLLTFVGG